MFKRILSVSGLIFLMAWGPLLKAAEAGKQGPTISLNPTAFNVGDIQSPAPVTRRIVIKNIGESLLYISKVKYT
jgi:hypothetical protein